LRVFLVAGDPDGCAGFGDRVGRVFGFEVALPRYREVVTLA
jgi:hypothetical protein